MAGQIKNLLNRDGRYFARLTVPEKLRSAVGKRELRTPLGPDRRTAIRNLPRELARLQDIVDKAARTANHVRRSKNRELADVELAHLHYSEELAADDLARDIPPIGEPLPGELPQISIGTSGVGSYNELFASGRLKVLSRVAAGNASDKEIAAVVGWAILQAQQRGHTAVEDGTPEWRRLGRMLAGIEIEAVQRSLERDQGDFAGAPVLPILKETPPTYIAKDQVSLTELAADFQADLLRRGKGRRRERYAPVIKHLVAFVGHDDAARLTKQDIVKWINTLLDQFSAKTVRDSYLAGIKMILRFGVQLDRLQENVATGTGVRPDAKRIVREKGFTDEEALAILQATFAYTRKNNHAAAKRWVPWICAFTGARVGEIVQLRKQDVRLDGEIPYLHLTPDAGTIKTNQYRDVPLHPQILDLGFVEFVRRVKGNRLFMNPDPGKDFDKIMKAISNSEHAIASWVRTVITLEPGLTPNHAWRHRFKTIGREHILPAQVIDAICGHAPRTIGESYGSVPLRAKADAIGRLPAFPVPDGAKLI